jgi:membrane-bound lytic murein transglycosylase D
MDVKSAARLAGMELDDFIALNPAFSRNLIRSDTPINILVPVDKTDHFQDSLKNGTWDTWTSYYAKKGERLEALASRFDTSVTRLKEHNTFNLQRGKLVRAQTILIPVKGRAAVASKPDNLELASVEATRHTVNAGETLFSIARRYNITVSALKLANPELNSTVRAGQILLLPVKVRESNPLKVSSVAELPLNSIALTQKIKGKDGLN